MTSSKMKKIFIIFLTFVSITFAQRSSNMLLLMAGGREQPIDISIGGWYYASHDSIVGWSFVQGYESSDRSFGDITYVDSTEWKTDKFRIHFYHRDVLATQLAQAKEDNSILYIRSTTGIDTSVSLTYYPQITTVMPAGSNSHTQTLNYGSKLSNVLLTGAGDDANETAYDIEFYAPDPTSDDPTADLSSFSNGYIAGQIFALSDILNISIWQARCLARNAGDSWSSGNGYGTIDVPSILSSYSASNCVDQYKPILGEVGNITLSSDANDVSISMQSVTYADNYILERQIDGGDWEVLQSADDTTYEDADLPDSLYKYRYKAQYLAHKYLADQNTSYSNIEETFIQDTLPALRVFLEGAYSSSSHLMSTTLNSGGYLPLSQPYDVDTLWNYTGTETVESIPNSDITDWVLLELRSDTNTAVERKACFVRKNGRIVGLNGTSYPDFDTTGSYYIVVYHRNHLSIMSKDKITIGNGFDFADSSAQVYGNDMKNLGDGNWGMYAGDADVNGIVQSTPDFNVVFSQFFQAGYKQGNLNLDAVVDGSDFGYPTSNNEKQTHVPEGE